MSRRDERVVELITPPGGIGPEVELPMPLENEVLSVEFPPGEYRAPFPLTPALVTTASPSRCRKRA